jgi:hypothetical protein
VSVSFFEGSAKVAGIDRFVEHVEVGTVVALGQDAIPVPFDLADSAKKHEVRAYSLPVSGENRIRTYAALIGHRHASNVMPFHSAISPWARMTGLEPATVSFERSCSSFELHPQK